MSKKRLVIIFVAMGAIIASSVYGIVAGRKTRHAIQEASDKVIRMTNLQDLDTSIRKFEQWRKSLSQEENQTFLSLANIVHSPDFSKEKLSPKDMALLTRAIREATALGIFDKAYEIRESYDMDLATRNIVWDLFTLRRVAGVDSRGR